MSEITLEKLLELVRKYNPSEAARVEDAYYYAESLHCNQKRQSGEPYIIHPLNVCYILATLHADGDTLCAGLLHDTLEDTAATKEDIAYYFGNTVANLVEGVTNFDKSDFNSKKAEEAANLRKIIVGLTFDVRIDIIKLADRLHNMRTLEFKSKEKQKEKAIETMEIYVPLAHSVGINVIKSELEDLAFMYLKPNDYARAKEKREIIEANDIVYLTDMLNKTKQLLDDENIPNNIKLRIKNIYGVYRRLIRKDRDPHDLLALKVMVESLDNCYKALGLIHSMYHPVDNKFKDYICRSKGNLYKSLHTTVMNERESLVQFQIRTYEMEEIATLGLPAYWEMYREKGAEKMQYTMSQDSLFKVIEDIDRLHKSDRAFISDVKREIFKTNIQVYTKRGDIVTLPEGSTVVDFAYSIHTDVGYCMVKALVNGEEVPFWYELKGKDRVEIITGEFDGSNFENMWKYATTARAKRAIKLAKSDEKKKQFII